MSVIIQVTQPTKKVVRGGHGGVSEGFAEQGCPYKWLNTYCTYEDATDKDNQLGV